MLSCVVLSFHLLFCVLLCCVLLRCTSCSTKVHFCIIKKTNKQAMDKYRIKVDFIFKFDYLESGWCPSSIFRERCLEFELELQTTKSLSNYKSAKALQVVTSFANKYSWNLFYLCLWNTWFDIPKWNLYVWMLTILRIMPNLIISSLIFPHVRSGGKRRHCHSVPVNLDLRHFLPRMS